MATSKPKKTKKPAPKKKPVPRDKHGMPKHTTRGKTRINKPKDQLDETDLQILVRFLVDPKTSQTEIADKIGKSQSTVFRRLRAIQEGTMVSVASMRFEEMLPLVNALYFRQIIKGDLQAAHDVAFGTGTLRTRHEVKHEGLTDGKPETIAKFIASLDTKTLERVIHCAIEQISGGPETDGGGMVDGAKSSPDMAR